MHFGNSYINLGAQRQKAVSWEEYQKRVGKHMDMLEGYYADQLAGYARKVFSDKGWNSLYRDRYPWSSYTNLMQDFVSKIGVVYSEPARRVYNTNNADGTVTNDANYQKCLEGAGLDYALHQAERYVLATGGILIRPALRADLVTWAIQVITPDCFTVCSHLDDPTVLTEVQYVMAAPDSQGVGGLLYYRYEWSILDPLSPFWKAYGPDGKILGGQGGTALEPYPYYDPGTGQPILPFAVLSFEAPPGMLFNRGAGVDLQEATLQAALLEATKIWLLLHSRKQPTFVGPKADSIASQIADPSTPWVSPVDAKEGEFGLLDFTQDVTLFDTSIDKLKERLAERRGMTLADFKETGQVESGKALKIRSKGKQVYISSLRESCRQTERELAYIMRIIWNAHNTGSLIDWGATLRIDYTDILAGDPFENHQELKELRDMNVISTVDLYQRHNPDIGDTEQAKEAIVSNMQLNAELAGITAQAAALAAIAIPPVPPVTG